MSTAQRKRFDSNQSSRADQTPWSERMDAAEADLSNYVNDSEATMIVNINSQESQQ